MKMETIIVAAILMSAAIALAASPEQQNVQAAINNYYTAFSQKNMDAFLSMRVFPSPEAREHAKQLTEKEWSSMDILGYRLSNMRIDMFQDVAIASYYLRMKIGFGGETVADIGEEMKAILARQNGEWKILMVGQKDSVDAALSSLRAENLTVSGMLHEETVKDDTEGKCGDGVCEIGEACYEDCQDMSYQPKCGDGICEKNETCPYDCGKPEHVEMVSAPEPECSYIELIEMANGKSIRQPGIPDWAINMIAGNSRIRLDVDGTSYYFMMSNQTLHLSNATKPDYIINTSSCALSSIGSGSMSFQTAYDQKLITIKGVSIGGKMKSFAGNIIMKIVSLFSPPPKKVYVEGESGKLFNAGRYSFVRAGENGILYLGTGGSYAKYRVQNPINGKAYVYIRVFDDGKHRNGARNAEITISNQTLNYSHISKNTGWAWEYLGEVELRKGPANIIISKPQQTSAAFVMDKMLISSKKE